MSMTKCLAIPREVRVVKFQELKNEVAYVTGHY